MYISWCGSWYSICWTWGSWIQCAIWWKIFRTHFVCVQYNSSKGITITGGTRCRGDENILQITNRTCLRSGLGCILRWTRHWSCTHDGQTDRQTFIFQQFFIQVLHETCISYVNVETPMTKQYATMQFTQLQESHSKKNELHRVGFKFALVY